MGGKIYAVGNMVVLKGSRMRSGKAESTCRIVSVLPNDYGQAQYRVRFEGENFERHISDTDIDTTRSEPPTSEQPVMKAVKTKPWVTLSGIKIGR